MTKKEYVERKIMAGHELHKHDGVWWETTRNGYCKPAVLFDEVIPKKSRPIFSKSYMGYSHRVSNSASATGVWTPFILKNDELTSWSLAGLKSGNRKRRIKKGLKFNEVKVVKNIENYKADFSRILISTAIRNGHGKPPEHYDMNKIEWWKKIVQVAKYTEFWCAFDDGALSAYICLHVMGDRAVIDGVKSDTDLLNNCPIDAILYHIITDLSARGTVKELWYGGKSNRPSLDKFKTSYGFQIVEVPYQIRIAGGLFKYPRFINNFRSTTET